MTVVRWAARSSIWRLDGWANVPGASRLVGFDTKQRRLENRRHLARAPVWLPQQRRIFQTLFNVSGLFSKPCRETRREGTETSKSHQQEVLFFPFNHEFHLEEGDVDVTTMHWGQRQKNAAGLVEDSKILLWTINWLEDRNHNGVPGSTGKRIQMKINRFAQGSDFPSA